MERMKKRFWRREMVVDAQGPASSLEELPYDELGLLWNRVCSRSGTHLEMYSLVSLSDRKYKRVHMRKSHHSVSFLTTTTRRRPSGLPRCCCRRRQELVGGVSGGRGLVGILLLLRGILEVISAEINGFVFVFLSIGKPRGTLQEKGKRGRKRCLRRRRLVTVELLFMGDHGGFSRPSSSLLNGLLPNKAASVTRVLDADRWSMVEARTAELIQCIQPNQQSEMCRNAVANYVQRLIMKCFSCQVFTFGSVPLKTYLPDGDIDMTAFSKNPILKDMWADDVRNMLETEERSENAEFRVNEVQYIQAEHIICPNSLLFPLLPAHTNFIILITKETKSTSGCCDVKIIKCLVENIVVDISFNQLGGLCTLCFLEEVLYRFLEFFSNFDWENFCVSLWGPIPINSLPDMKAEPPRKDNGEVLLSKLYLDACSSKYSVSPSIQENQGQPFVSKFFNIIDPLRINNNLGRSVSKVIEIRSSIRGSLASRLWISVFGECREVIAWIFVYMVRIRSAFAFGAKRLAALLECPKDDLPSDVDKFFMNIWRQHKSSQRPDAPSPDLWNMQPSSNVETPVEAVSTQAISQPVSTVDQSAQNFKKNDVSKSSGHTAQVEGGLNSSELVENDKSQKTELREGSGSFQFARTRSSPELSDTSADFSSRQRNRLPDTVKNQNPATREDHASQRKNLGSEIFINYCSKTSPDDLSYPRHGSAYQNFDVPDDSAFTSTNQGNADFLATGEGFVSWQKALEMHQEQQDLINMTAVSEAVPHGLYSTQMLSCDSNAGLLSSPEVVTEASIKRSSITEEETENADRGSWADQNNGSTRPSCKVNKNVLTLHYDGKRTSSTGSLSSSNIYKSSSHSTGNGYMFVREDQGLVGEDSNRVHPYLSLRDQDSNLVDDITNLRSCSNTQPTSSSGKSSSESSCDEAPTMSSQLARDKHRRRGTSTSAPFHGTTKSMWDYDNLSSDSVPIGADDNREWVPLSMMGSDVVERTMDSGSMAPMQVHTIHSLGHESPHSSNSDPMVPIRPVLVSASSQRGTADNTGMLPFAFYPTGPPVPFLAMLPVCHYDSSTSVGSTSHFDNIGLGGSGHRNSSDLNFDLTEGQERPVAHIGVGTMKDEAFEQSEVHNPDILNSDFANHWQNLQFGKFCQNTRYPGPLMYSSPVVIPPMYLQGHFPLDGPEDHYLGQTRPTNVYRGYLDDVPRYRGGTGTYLPNQNLSFRDQQALHARSHGGHYGNDHSDRSDREGSWLKSKSRASGRSRGRNQTEKVNPRSKRLTATDNMSEAPWNSYRDEPLASYPSPSNPFSSMGMHGSGNIPHGMHPLPTGNSSRADQAGSAAPSVMMFYSYDHGAGHDDLSSEQPEFGLLGSLHVSGVDEAAHAVDGDLVRFNQRQEAYGRGSGHSSPDHPSSPQAHRRYSFFS
ncbi:unnamed protein product [Spirodela intermedia]|uniref:PAP/OAS1 substrate-binding-related domain-containing protein n=1 Tax=Spirodela intermedia TaxID=51605 RepID=A0A7I8JIT2_SPIIN|nr:unnamed protein product [Spirodela intermedia]CAA6670066.1 unnamed protein product [Spirodela intermedia]